MQRAVMKNVRMLMDAEQTYYQPAIRSIVNNLMKMYNKDRPIFYSTIQSYLKVSAKINNLCAVNVNVVYAMTYFSMTYDIEIFIS